MGKSLVLDVPSYDSPSHWMVGARTYLIDRIVPDVEYICLPPARIEGGTIEAEIVADGEMRATRGGWRRLVHRIARHDGGAGSPTGLLMDLRLSSPSNWAHSLNFHLPMAELVRSWSGEPVTAVLPLAIPGYVRRLFEHFGFPVVATDQAVRGRLCRFKARPHQALRSNRRQLVAALLDEQDRRRAAGEAPTGLPTRVFVARRKGRALTNEAEVEALLAARDYTKIYPEDLSVAAQLELFNGATHIVAIHSAGLAPLIYRSVHAPKLEMIELLSPGHMTNAYRHAVNQLGGTYVAVRGRLGRDHFPGAHDGGAAFLRHSLDDFAVDPVSLTVALDMAASGGRPTFPVA